MNSKYIYSNTSTLVFYLFSFGFRIGRELAFVWASKLPMLPL